MGTLKKTLIFCAAFMALVSAYAQDCASQHLVKTKESHVIKTLEPRLTFEYIKKNRRNPNFVILDIRTPQEFQSGYIEGAINIDYYSPDLSSRPRQARQIKNLLHILQDWKTHR